MHRNWFVLALGLLAFAWIGAPAATADDGALLQENQQLRERVDALESERDALLNQEIEEYLDEADVAGAAQAAGGDAFSRMDTAADVTIIIQILTDNNAGSPGVLSGDIDWTWTYHATDNMDIWLELNIATNNAGFPSQLPTVSPTLSGRDDGLGVNSNENRASGGSNLNLYQGGMHIWGDRGESRWHFWMAKVDPRRYFLQNAFAKDEETQWLNDLFISTTAQPWRTGNVNVVSPTAGVAQLGGIFKLEFGTDHNMWVTAGYWNGAGRWFDRGAGAIEWGLKHQLSGRDANLILMFRVDGATSTDNLLSAGLSWDWWVSEAIGLFVKANWNNADASTPAHVVEIDIAIGAIWYGPMESRPNDHLGLAIGTNMPNDDVVLGLDDEIVIETYYRYQVDAYNGKLHVTLGLMFVLDPAGAQIVFGGEDFALFVHLRVHGTF